MTVSPVPPSVDMTVTCTTGVVPMSTQPPVVTSVPAMSTATVTSREIDVCVGRSDVDPVPRLGPASSSAEERVPAVALSSPLLSGPPVSVLVGESVPAVELSSALMSEHTVPVPMGECVPAVGSFSTPSSGRSSTPSSRTLAWGMRATRRYSCPPTVFRRGALRTFRRRAVSFMCHRFRRDFCLGHYGKLSRFLWRGYYYHQQWMTLVTRTLVPR